LGNHTNRFVNYAALKKKKGQRGRKRAKKWRVPKRIK